MECLAIVCATIIIMFFMYLYYKATEVYVDEEVQKGRIVNGKGQCEGYFVRYKRTHKNGRATFHETNYTS